VFGDDALGAKALALFQSALQPKTYINYGSNMTSFFTYCEENAIPYLDVTTIDIARYIAWMGERGTVAADSLQPYLSAINKFLLDHGKPPVALGAMVAGVRLGLANCQTDMAPTPERLPLPAPVALAILERAEALLRKTRHTRSVTDIRLLRACLATIASYIFFCRGECGACAMKSDLIVNDSHITLRLRKEKGKNALKEGHKNTRQILVDDMPRVAAALLTFFTLTEKKHRKCTRRWATTRDEERCSWNANTSTEWLHVACKATGNSPPKGFSWTSHSLRKGAASAANAIKVPLTDIRYSGGWSTNSNVLEAKYIDFAMAPSKAAYIFFGHLKRDKPLDA
jgi:hypothetical protein